MSEAKETTTTTTATTTTTEPAPPAGDAETSKLAEAEPLFYGRWKAEEERYAEMLIQEFRAGNLDIEDGTTLRGYLAKMLNCAPKRISKKFESSGYNGRAQYIGKPATFSPEEAQKRREELEAARLEFEARRKGLAKKKRKPYTKSAKFSASILNNKKKAAEKKAAAAAAAAAASAATTDDSTVAPSRAALSANAAAATSAFNNPMGHLLGQSPAVALFQGGGGGPGAALYGLSSGRDPLTASLYARGLPGLPTTASALGSMESTALGASLLASNHRPAGLTAAAAAGGPNRPMVSTVEASLLDTILGQSNAATPASRLLASHHHHHGLPSTTSAVDHLMHMSSVDTAQVLAQARREAEQRAILQQMADQRKRLHSVLDASAAATRRSSIDPPEAEAAAKRARFV